MVILFHKLNSHTQVQSKKVIDVVWKYIIYFLTDAFFLTGNRNYFEI